jgi:hypothetical protein
MILTVALNTRMLKNYYAYGYIKASFLLSHNWTTSVSAGAGGYSLFNLGADVGKTWRNIDFILGSNNLIGSILPMYYPGSSVYFRVAATSDTMIQTDILIIGAGPGGAATALFLAKQGIGSILVDKATFPRDKICGDALSGKEVEVLRKLDPSLVSQSGEA